MTETHTAKCARCGRTLKSAKSVAAGMGRTCAKRTRQDAAVLDFKPAQVEKAKELIEQGGIVPLRAKRVFLVASSNGNATYRTAKQACSCPAGIKSRTCYHVIAAHLLAA